MITNSKKLTSIFYINFDETNSNYTIKKFDLSKFTKKFINRLIETKNKLVFSNEKDCNNFCNTYLNTLLEKKNKLDKEYNKQYNIWEQKYKNNKESLHNVPNYSDEYLKVFEEFSFVIKDKLILTENNLFIDNNFLVDNLTKNYKNTSYPYDDFGHKEILKKTINNIDKFFNTK